MTVCGFVPNISHIFYFASDKPFVAASWLDHSRDLLHFINLKRDEMPRPIVGIGHSFGGAQLYAFPIPCEVAEGY